jgi:hypothetical protein
VRAAALNEVDRLTRNEGVPGSNPGVGFGENPHRRRGSVESAARGDRADQGVGQRMGQHPAREALVVTPIHPPRALCPRCFAVML